MTDNVRGSARLAAIALYPWSPESAEPNPLWESIAVSHMAEWELELLSDPNPAGWLSAAGDVLHRCNHEAYFQPRIIINPLDARSSLSMAWARYHIIRAVFRHMTEPDDATPHSRAWAARIPGILDFLAKLLEPLPKSP